MDWAAPIRGEMILDTINNLVDGAQIDGVEDIKKVVIGYNIICMGAPTSSHILKCWFVG